MFEDFSFCTECGYYDRAERKCNLFDRTMVCGCPNGTERKPRNNYEKLKAMSMNEMAEEIVLLFCRFPLDYEKLLEWLKEGVDGET